MSKNKFILSIKLFIPILFLTIFISCSNESDPLPAQEDHFEAEGVVLLESGIIIADIFRGVTNDTLFVPVDSMTAGIDVKFYDENQQIIDPPDPSDQSLSWSIDDQNILDVWQHPGEEGGFELHLEGLAIGSTKIEFFIVHEGHNDFRSGKFSVVVQ